MPIKVISQTISFIWGYLPLSISLTDLLQLYVDTDSASIIQIQITIWAFLTLIKCLYNYLYTGLREILRDMMILNQKAEVFDHPSHRNYVSLQNK